MRGIVFLAGVVCMALGGYLLIFSSKAAAGIGITLIGCVAIYLVKPPEGKSWSVLDAMDFFD